MNENHEKKWNIPVRKIVRILALVSFVFCFMPMFLVSCSGQTKEIGVAEGIGGISVEVYEGYSETYSEPHAILMFLVLIPLIILILTFLKKLEVRPCAGISVGCILFDVVLWFSFYNGVEEAAKKYYCEMKPTSWYYINLFVLLGMMVLFILALAGVLSMDPAHQNLSNEYPGTQAPSPGHATEAPPTRSQRSHSPVSRSSVSSAIGQVANSASAFAGSIAANHNKRSSRFSIGRCAQCGTTIEYGAEYCPNCGLEVPVELIVTAREERERAEKSAKAAGEAAHRIALERARLIAEEKARREAEEQKRREEEARRTAVERQRREAEARRTAVEQQRQVEEARRAAVEQQRRVEEARRAAKAQQQQGAQTAPMAQPSHWEDEGTTMAPQKFVPTAQRGPAAEQPKPQFCSECGAKLMPGFMFCPACGTQVEE